MNLLTIFLPYSNPDETSRTLEEFNSCGLDCRIFVLCNVNDPAPDLPAGIETISISSQFSTETFRKIAIHSKTEYLVIYSKPLPLKLGPYALQRMLQVAQDTFSGFVYSDYYAMKGQQMSSIPLIDNQEGSLRDDFNFGSLILFETASFIESVARLKESFIYAGFYDLRLKLSQKHNLFHIPEFLYTETEMDLRKTGEKLFDYVDPGNRQVQIEMEKACTEHLKESGAWLEPRFRKVHFDENHFEHEASVVIPVKNRSKTISEAIHSVLAQKTTFGFNLIIVDNHSTDGTSEIIRSFRQTDRRIIHLIPGRTDLGIGGCWNEALFHPSCGKFAVQLDSDDLYIDERVLSRMVEAFYEQSCAMLIGTYRMVNFDLEEIPPGIIDHREWTPDNGRNNALRINGLGAPRAFYTPVIRSITMPNVSYGEDYAVGLSISRYYQIGRIYEPLYLCRRWEENSDAALDVKKMNTYNFYKDKLRTIELKARQLYVQEGQEI